MQALLNLMPRIDHDPALLVPKCIIFNDKDIFMNQGRQISIFGGIEKELERDEDVGAEKKLDKSDDRKSDSKNDVVGADHKSNARHE
jgi:hypothetical protein